MDIREQFIGKTCTYIDEVTNQHDALITAVHGVLEDGSAPWSINLVYVVLDPAMADQYGRQIKRENSVPVEAKAGAHGRFFRL